MKKFLALFLVFSFTISVYGKTYEGEVSEISKNLPRIIDKQTGKGISGAQITIPKQGYRTRTDKDGYFELDTSIDGTSIMSVQKHKYKPFSMTINSQNINSPLVVGIEKSDSAAISIDANMYHLGDGSYSDLSANAGEIKSNSLGPFYTKKFNLKSINSTKPVYLVIGSIIGIDTLIARSMGQNKNPNSYASPPEVYFNGNKISEIQINGDGQKIRIPSNLIRKNRLNEITIKTGRNLMQTSYIDYDDIEFMNLIIEN